MNDFDVYIYLDYRVFLSPCNSYVVFCVFFDYHVGGEHFIKKTYMFHYQSGIEKKN